MGEMRNAYKILVGKHKGKECLGDLGIYGSIILNWILSKQCEAVDCIQLTHNRVQWGVLVKTVMKSRFS